MLTHFISSLTRIKKNVCPKLLYVPRRVALEVYCTMKVFNLAFLLLDDKTLVVAKNTLIALKCPLL